MLLLRSPAIFHEDTTFFCSRASRVISAATGSPLTGMVFGISAVFLKKSTAALKCAFCSVTADHVTSERERERERERACRGFNKQTNKNPIRDLSRPARSVGFL